MSPLRRIVSIFGALALTGCTLSTSGMKVHTAGLSTIRPDGTIGPSGSEGAPPWKIYTVELPSRLARTLVGTDSTFHLRVTDCRHKDAGRLDNGHFNIQGLIGVEDVYVDGLTLNGSSSRSSRLRESKVRLFRASPTSAHRGSRMSPNFASEPPEAA